MFMNHDANFWAAWAAWAAAIAAIASLVTSFYSYHLSKRSTMAAEDSLRMSVRPDVTFNLPYLQTDGDEPITFRITNRGPGRCRELRLWEATTSQDRDFDLELYPSKFRAIPLDKDKLDPKDTVQTAIPACPQVLMVQFEDAVGNLELRTVEIIKDRFAESHGNPIFSVRTLGERLQRRRLG